MGFILILAVAAGTYALVQNAPTWVSYLILSVPVAFVLLVLINPNTALGFLGISIVAMAMLGLVIAFVKFLPQVIGAVIFVAFVVALMYAIGNFA